MRGRFFRGKQTENGEWIYGYYYRLECGDKEKSYISKLHSIVPTLIEVIPDTVGQYTGITDKNGVKIFEGDTVRYKDALINKMYCGVVNFADASFRITDGGFHGYRWQDYEVEVVKERHGEELDG